MCRQGIILALLGVVLWGDTSSGESIPGFSVRSIQLSETGQVAIAWSAIPCTMYRVQFTDSLSMPWQTLPDSDTSAGPFDRALSAIDNGAMLTAHRYYRVQLVPPPLILSLIVDRSDSMNFNGGAILLPSMISGFLEYLDETRDHVALVSFASNIAVDLPMTNEFKAAVYAKLGQMTFSGFTYTDGGLRRGHQEIGSIFTAPSVKPVRVAFLFTDGLPDTLGDTFRCGEAQEKINLTGLTPPNINCVGLIDPSTGALVETRKAETALGICENGPFAACPDLQEFVSITGTNYPVLGDNAGLNVRTEARLRALAIANAMRADGINICALGIGATVDFDFLKQLANAPDSPTFNSGQPVGIALLNPDQNQLLELFNAVVELRPLCYGGL